MRLDPPITRCWAVLIGMIAWSSSLVAPVDPDAASTPITSNGLPSTVIDCPTGSTGPNSSVAVLDPSTVTAATD